MSLNPELSYLNQSSSWKEGMTYRLSPDYYPVTPEQISAVKDCGELVGNYLTSQISNKIIEFRLDMIKDNRGKLWVTEVQTDDRGLPAMAIARNARGNSPTFPGLLETLDLSMKERVKANEYVLALIYPDAEYFYYAGLTDVKKILWSISPKSEILVAPRSQINIDETTLKYSVPYQGLVMKFIPNFIWDFSESIDSPVLIQPKITKQMLSDIWERDNNLNIQLRNYIPEIRPFSDPEVINSKDDWILKPINGRWSKGVVHRPRNFDNQLETTHKQSTSSSPTLHISGVRLVKSHLKKRLFNKQRKIHFKGGSLFRHSKLTLGAIRYARHLYKIPTYSWNSRLYNDTSRN